MGAELGPYGVKSASSTKAKPISTNNTLAFTSSLSSLINQPKIGKPTSRRPAEKKAKDDLFVRPPKKQKRETDLVADRDGNVGHVQDIGGVEDAILQRSKRRLEKKAQLYKDLKKGYGAYAGEAEHGNGLVDFDQKWAEGDASTSEEDAEEDGQLPLASVETVEYTDEFGRARKGTRLQQEQALKAERLRQNIRVDADENSWQPPSNLIIGDTIQSHAFNPDEQVFAKMETMAKKRDRSMTPPEETHYDASKEVRSKGVGFYAFSRDQKTRDQELENLKVDRETTESVKRAKLERVALEEEGDELLRKLEKEADIDGLLNDIEKKSEPG